MVLATSCASSRMVYPAQGRSGVPSRFQPGYRPLGYEPAVVCSLVASGRTKQLCAVLSEHNGSTFRWHHTSRFSSRISCTPNRQSRSAFYENELAAGVAGWIGQLRQERTRVAETSRQRDARWKDAFRFSVFSPSPIKLLWDVGVCRYPRQYCSRSLHKSVLK